MRIDLHSHTTASDGLLTPEELVLRALNYQLDYLAITDHDCIDGIEPAMAAVADSKLKIISGVEISTCWYSFEIHILGLNFDLSDGNLNLALAEQQQKRIERAARIGEKLTKIGFESVEDEARQLAGHPRVTRAHYAKALLNAGHVSNWQAAFKKYLGKGQRAYVRPNWMTVAEAIQTIQKAGGQAVLAHPSRYDLSNKWIRKLVAEFA